MRQRIFAATRKVFNKKIFATRLLGHKWQGECPFCLEDYDDFD